MSGAIDQRAVCDADIGTGCRVGAFSVLADGSRLGDDVRVGHHVVIGPDAQLGDGVVVDDGAVVGAGAHVRPGARVGLGATVAPGIEVGHGAIVSDGSVVTRDVPRHTVVAAPDVHITGYVGADGPSPMQPVRQPSALDHAAPGTSETDVRGVQLHRLPEARDLRGSLVAGELEQRLPFVPRRYFLVHGVPSAEVRGEHAHHVCHQFLTAVHGELHVIADDGVHRQEFVLNDERTGLYLPPMVWGVQYRYSEDCKLLVLASHPYDAADYIRDYGEFLELLAGS